MHSNRQSITFSELTLLLSCLTCLTMLFDGCSKNATINHGTTVSGAAGFDVNASLDVDGLMKIIRGQDPDHCVIATETVQAIMAKHGQDIQRAAGNLNDEHSSCLSSLNEVVQDISDCDSDERTVLNVLISEMSRIEWLNANGQNDIQRTMWRVLKDAGYYAFDTNGSEEETINDISSTLRELIQAGADLNAPNWDGEIGAFYIDDAQFMLELVKSGAVRHDIKDQNGNCLLHRFASDEGLIDQLVQSGLDINTQNKDGQTPLFNVRKAKVLDKYIKAGADINHADHAGNTPIFYAAKNDSEHFPLSAEFVRLGADINHINNAGQTAVFGINIKNGLQDFVNLGARLAVKDSKGNTPLHHYDIKADNEALDALDIYLKSGVDVNSTGDKPILTICTGSDEYTYILNQACADKLVKAGANLSAKAGDGLGFLSYMFQNQNHLSSDSLEYARNELKLKYDQNLNAIKVIADMRDAYDKQVSTDRISDYTELMSVVLGLAETDLLNMEEDGTLNADARMPDGETFLFYVTDDLVAKVLITKGADINARNKRGETALWRGNIDVLINAGADVNATDNNGQTPLFANDIYYVGSDFGSLNAFNARDITKLLAAGANINARDAKGRSVIFHVLEHCDYFDDEDCDNRDYCGVLQAIHYLAAHGADINISDNDGITPLMLVCSPDFNGDDSYITELIKAGADVNAKDHAGKSVIDHCSQNNNANLIEILKKAGAR